MTCPEHGIPDCSPLLNGCSRQLEFADVVELEPQKGDPEYTEWVRAGRPKLDGATRNAMAKHPTRQIDTLPGL